jgi:hypothetical protein
MKSMNKPPRKHGHNVVELAIKKKAVSDQPVYSFAKAAQAFLAIEDAAARSALIALAERLVSYDWIRKVK